MKEECIFYKFVSFEKDGTVRFETFASLNGKTWGLVDLKTQNDLYANIGYHWEAFVLGEDDPDEIGSSSCGKWYKTWEEAIADTLYDFEGDPSIISRLDQDKDWRAFWLDNFEKVGEYSPSGWPIYEYRPTKGEK
jgi:spore maturation protein CgeB